MTCASQYKDATRGFIDQMDTVKRIIQRYPDTFVYATSAADIEDALKTGHIASMIGVEGGHAIDSSLATLRQLYQLGARYMTLTHFCDTLWLAVFHASICTTIYDTVVDSQGSQFG